MTDSEKLSRAIRYLADSDACTRVQDNGRGADGVVQRERITYLAQRRRFLPSVCCG